MRVIAMILMMFLCANRAFAATVDLIDGRVVHGTVIKQDINGIQINVDGVAMTYYADEIKDIDGRLFVNTPAVPVQQATTSGTVAPVTVVPVAVTPVTVTPVAADLDQESPTVVDQDKKALILKFIDVFGTRQALINNFDIMVSQIEKEKPDEAEKIRERVKIDEIIERLVPIYDRNFSSEDLKSYIAFYESTEGQKLITAIPKLMKESVQESIKYMEEKFPEVKQGQ